MFLILKHGGGALQSCDHMQPLQERLIVKTLKLPSASFSEARSIAQNVHTVIAWDEKVLHNAAAYSFQEQSGAPSLCHTPKSAGKLMINV